MPFSGNSHLHPLAFCFGASHHGLFFHNSMSCFFSFFFFLFLSTGFYLTVVRCLFATPTQRHEVNYVRRLCTAATFDNFTRHANEAAWLPWAQRFLPKPNFSSLKVPLPCVVIISPLCLLKQRALWLNAGKVGHHNMTCRYSRNGATADPGKLPLCTYCAILHI